VCEHAGATVLTGLYEADLLAVSVILSVIPAKAGMTA
jgi:hypothetical protein